MVIPEDPEQQKCGGIIDSAKSVGGASGKKIKSIMSKIAVDLLKKSVLNEEHIIEQGPITIYTKM